jgi:hypothetical protein
VGTGCFGGTRCPGGTICAGGSGCPGGSVFEPIGPEGLAALKAQLRLALEQVEAQEKDLAERMAPQTVEDVEALETQLQEALEELRERKETLRKRESEGDEG